MSLGNNGIDRIKDFEAEARARQEAEQSAKGLNTVGQLGDSTIAQVDVRTDVMKQLEQGLLALLGPIMKGGVGGAASMFAGLTPPVPGAASFNNPFAQAASQPGIYASLFGRNPLGGAMQTAMLPGGPPSQPPPRNLDVPPPVPRPGFDPNSPNVTFRAAGGPLDPNAINVVGESGPEIILPGAQGTVIPATHGSAAAPRPFGSAGLTSEQLRAQMEAPGYQSPTVAGLNAPSTPGYVWGANGQATPGYSTSFNGQLTSGTAQMPTQQSVEQFALSGGAQGQAPQAQIAQPTQPAAPPAGGGMAPGPGQPPAPLQTGGPQMRGGSQPPPAFTPDPNAPNTVNPNTGPPAPMTDLQNGILGGGAFGAQSPFAQGLGINSSQQVADSLRQQLMGNVDATIARARGQVPSMYNSGSGMVIGDALQRMLNDVGAQTSQAMLQGRDQDISAGRAQTERVLGAGQFGQGMTQLGLQEMLGLGQMAQNQQQFDSTFGLNAQNQQWQQTMQPIMQMLMSFLGLATPTGYQTVVGQR